MFIGALHLGGAERVMAWLARNLAEEGHRVTVVTLDDGSRDAIRLDNRVARIGLGLFKSNATVLKPFAAIRRIRALRSVMRKRRPATLLAFMPQESVMAILAGIGMGSRVVIAERQAPWRRSAGRPWDALRKLLFRFAAVQVAQTSEIAKWLKDTAKCRDIIVIPNAVQYPLSTDMEGIPSIMPPRDGRPFILAVGTKPYQKGFDTLIEAFARSNAAKFGWDLHILGLEPERDEKGVSLRSLQDLAQERGVNNQITIHGRVSNMAEWYSAAGLFVLSSRFEGFPNVLVEAMSYGCPSVAMDCETGPSDIIDHGHNGLLVRDGSVADLSNAMNECVSNTDLRVELCKNALKIREMLGEDRILALWSIALGLKTAPQAGTGAGKS